MANNSIINMSELSKPATVLIEKISNAVGAFCKPYQIVRVAKAEAEAERIKVESQIEISDFQRRAFYRFLKEEANKQKNIEGITQKAIPQLKADSKPQDVEDDWITNFFDKCRLISDNEMQSLWSRVLAGEANSPSSYSKRTINFLSSLDKSDAELFTKLCTFGWLIGDFVVPLIYDLREETYSRHGIYFNSLGHLESIGLIKYQCITSFTYERLPKFLTVFYYGIPLRLSFKKESDNEMKIGTVMLTKIGVELAPICGSQPDPDFEKYIREKWKEMNYLQEENTEPSGLADD